MHSTVTLHSCLQKAHSDISDGRYLLAHKVLQDRGLAGTLSAHHCNLGQVDGVGDAELGEDVLQPIHDGDEGLHPLVTRRHP